MICPECGSILTCQKTYDTKTDEVRRRRKCPVCARSVLTVERIELKVNPILDKTKFKRSTRE